MPKTIDKDSVEKVNNLSDEELEERFERDMKSFKKKLKQYSSE
jgi:t-SNARE complex subunit (syntaxin)